MNTDLSVIIPTYNNVEGIEYLLNFFKDKEYEVIVIDNKSTEEKRREVKKFESVKVIRYLAQKRNLGFAAGINQGAEEVKTKWLLIMNDDIEFKVKSEKLRIKNEETIQQLVNFAEQNNLDAVSPVLINPDGKVENYGYKVLPYGKIEILNTKYEILDTNVDGLTAACLLVKTEVFKKLNGFDESFFAYLEDVDFFLRFKKVGYKMGIAGVEVLHKHMTTSSTMGNFKARQDMINWWRLYFKHPDKFKFNLDFVLERLRNVSGFVKASLK